MIAWEHARAPIIAAICWLALGSAGCGSKPATPVDASSEVEPEEMPYRADGMVPPGYRVGTTPNVRLVASGAGLFGGLYMLLLPVAVDQSLGSGSERAMNLYVPLAGPLLLMGQMDFSSDGDNSVSQLIAAGLVVDALGQATGLALILAGFAMPKKRLVRRDVRAFAAPEVRIGPGGITLSGTF